MFIPESENAFKVYEQKNAIQKDASLGRYYITQEKFDELKGFAVAPGDIIVSCAGTIGETYVLPNDCKDGIINQALMIIRLFRPEILEYYLEYFNFVLKASATKDSKGTAIKNIPPFEILKAYPFPLPPIAEQQRIVEATKQFDRLFEMLNKNRDQIVNRITRIKAKILDIAMQGKLVPQDPTDEPASDMLLRINPKAKIITDNPHYPQLPSGWCIAAIRDTFEINPKNKADGDKEAGFVPMASICDGFNNSFIYTPRKWDEIKNGFTHFANGDIAVAKISPCLENRKSMILRNLPNGIGCGTTELLVFRSKVIYPEYGLLFFKSDNFIKQCVGTFNGVVGQQRVSKNIVEEIHFPIPPYKAQIQIANVVNRLFKTLDQINSNLVN